VGKTRGLTDTRFVSGHELRTVRPLAAIRRVACEFGVAEPCDSLVLRPLAMDACAAALGNVLAGVLLGKVLADVAFDVAEPAYEDVRRALPGVPVHYAVKCNPEPALLARLHGLGCGFEFASLAELELLRSLGVEPETLLSSNPVRLAVEDPTSRVPLALGLVPHGLTFHVGSQALDPGAYARGVARAGQVMWTLLEHGIRLETDRRLLRYPLRTPGPRRSLVCCSVTGQTCDSQDTVLRDALLPDDLEVGERVHVCSAGAYTTAYASRFNGFEIPPTLLLGRAVLRAVAAR
jgi:diaminopimelate decarboxylase